MMNKKGQRASPWDQLVRGDGSSMSNRQKASFPTASVNHDSRNPETPGDLRKRVIANDELFLSMSRAQFKN